jgi:hypothetical protein
MLPMPVLIPDPTPGEEVLPSVFTRTFNLEKILRALELRNRSPAALAESLPFSCSDATAGAENELQAVVLGEKEDVDLPITIEESNYYKNILRRVKAGEAPRRAVAELDKYLNQTREKAWENSWVRFPLHLLSSFARRVWEHDLVKDKSNPSGPRREDLHKFLLSRNGEEYLRVPVSYLLKLALADAVGSDAQCHPLVKTTAGRLLGHFLSDNTSPETFSFHPVVLRTGSQMGRALARETAIRFLLTQMLALYANHRFGLLSRGQRALVYFAPHPPVRQQRLNDIISDSFYRELFMSPCLSGWDQGEKKHQYMILCHQVLSRSQLNVIAKLKEAGIILHDLITLPRLSNTSLANNGTHVSLGSRTLTRLLQEGHPDFQPSDEKYLGDLVIKIFEHFLPLFVGTYSASPYRLDFWDFHPEKALGFLPHQLDYTHLRMIWRRWKKKAHLKIFGNPVTPFGPRWIDRPLSRLFQLRGDFVPDFRLIDYPVALLSTDQSPALDGTLGNHQRLKEDLFALGVFDPHMSLYLLYRNRLFSQSGFSGFEGRHYSLFYCLLGDLGEATSLQALITALAFQYISKGEFSHADIPDDPTVESERRQIFFGAAIGLPTFYVRRNTTNQFLKRILQKMEHTRFSRRYPGYTRGHHKEYRRALLRLLKEDGTDLIEVMGLTQTLEDLERRLADPPGHTALDRLTRGILERAGASSPLKIPGEDFNRAAEKFYRENLRKEHMAEALTVLEEEFKKLDSHILCEDCFYRDAHRSILGGQSAVEYLMRTQKDLLEESLPVEVLGKLIPLTLLAVHSNMRQYEMTLNGDPSGFTATTQGVGSESSLLRVS